MTKEEILRELNEDFWTLRHNKLERCKSDFKRVVLHASRYPVSKTYEYRTPNKNEIVIKYTARKRGEWNRPFENIYGLYRRDEGTYGVSFPNDNGPEFSIPSPHFFRRYRERILKNENMMPRNTINYFFHNEEAYMALTFNDAFREIYEAFEGRMKGDEVDFAGVTKNCYVFGKHEIIGKLIILKTLVSEDMLFPRQRPMFAMLRKIFEEHVTGRDIIDGEEVTRQIREACSIQERANKARNENRQQTPSKINPA